MCIRLTCPLGSCRIIARWQDSADGRGDLFFWMTDRLVAPYACRVSNGKWWGCKEQGTLDHNSVYTKTVLEVDGSWRVC